MASPARSAGRWQLVLVMVLFLAVVWTCYAGALTGLPWLGLAAVFVFLGVACALGPAVASVRALIALLAAVAGALCDTVLQACGAYTVPEASRWALPPPAAPEWIVALWFNFGVVLLDRAAWFVKRLWAAALVGVVFGLMIYSSAARRGLVDFGVLGVWGPAVVAAVWAVFVPLLYMMAALVARRLLVARAVPSEGAATRDAEEQAP